MYMHIYIYIYIYIYKFVWGTSLWHLFLSSHIFRHVLGHPRDQWGQKDQKFPDPLKMTPRSWKLAQRYNFWSQILYCHSFRTNHKFWPFLEHPRGQNGSKIAYFSKSNPQKLRICTDNWFLPRDLILSLV